MFSTLSMAKVANTLVGKILQIAFKLFGWCQQHMQSSPQLIALESCRGCCCAFPEDASPSLKAGELHGQSSAVLELQLFPVLSLNSSPSQCCSTVGSVVPSGVSPRYCPSTEHTAHILPCKASQGLPGESVSGKNNNDPWQSFCASHRAFPCTLSHAVPFRNQIIQFFLTQRPDHSPHLHYTPILPFLFPSKHSLDPDEIPGPTLSITSSSSAERLGRLSRLTLPLHKYVALLRFPFMASLLIADSGNFSLYQITARLLSHSVYSLL